MQGEDYFWAVFSDCLPVDIAGGLAGRDPLTCNNWGLTVEYFEMVSSYGYTDFLDDFRFVQVVDLKPSREILSIEGSVCQELLERKYLGHVFRFNLIDFLQSPIEEGGIRRMCFRKSRSLRNVRCVGLVFVVFDSLDDDLWFNFENWSSRDSERQFSIVEEFLIFAPWVVPDVDVAFIVDDARRYLEAGFFVLGHLRDVDRGESLVKLLN